MASAITLLRMRAKGDTRDSSYVLFVPPLLSGKPRETFSQPAYVRCAVGAWARRCGKGILGISGWSTPAVDPRPILYINWDDRGAQPKRAFGRSADCTPCSRVTRWYLKDVGADRWLPLPHDPRVVQSLALIRRLHRPLSIEDLPKQVSSNGLRPKLKLVSRCLCWDS